MGKVLGARSTRLCAALMALLAVGAVTASVALAFSEQYGFYEVGNNGYVQSENAHTFKFNFGLGGNGGRLACQLFNSKGANNVEHGNGSCAVAYGGGEYVWARVYNESGVGETVGGEAET
jgi:hypothetical protein